MKPVLQLALDFVDLSRAIKTAEEAVIGGVDWIEVGTPLIKSVGLDAVRKIRDIFPKKIIVADMKVIDVGRTEVEMAFKSGADIVSVLGLSSDFTILECVETARNYGGKIIVDLININIEDLGKKITEVEKLGVDYIGIHISIDKQMFGESLFFAKIKEIIEQANIPVAIAGGINSETVVNAINVGASIIIVGGAITKSIDVTKSTQETKKALLTGIKIQTNLNKKIGFSHIKELLNKVSTANLSDAFHRCEVLDDIFPIVEFSKVIGPVLTVKTNPGDWAKPVEAIDIAEPGTVIVIDAGGMGPAVWGELATYSAIQKKIAGVVINGAIRDIAEINHTKFPAFVKKIQSNAGEPKGFGEIGVPIKISGITIYSGDWAIGDSDGVVIIPQQKVVEIGNRAMDILEKENKIKKEIQEGKTLSEIIELSKWEKNN